MPQTTIYAVAQRAQRYTEPSSNSEYSSGDIAAGHEYGTVVSVVEFDLSELAFSVVSDMQLKLVTRANNLTGSSGNDEVQIRLGIIADDGTLASQPLDNTAPLTGEFLLHTPGFVAPGASTEVAALSAVKTFDLTSQFAIAKDAGNVDGRLLLGLQLDSRQGTSSPITSIHADGYDGGSPPQLTVTYTAAGSIIPILGSY